MLQISFCENVCSLFTACLVRIAVICCCVLMFFMKTFAKEKLRDTLPRSFT